MSIPEVSAFVVSILLVSRRIGLPDLYLLRAIAVSPSGKRNQGFHVAFLDVSSRFWAAVKAIITNTPHITMCDLAIAPPLIMVSMPGIGGWGCHLQPSPSHAVMVTHQRPNMNPAVMT